MPNIPTSSPPSNVPPAGKAQKLLDLYSEFLRNRHYSLRTEKTYIGWVRQYILSHNKRHPREMGVPEVEGFITHHATERKVAASTQNQPLSAILFLYREVLRRPLDNVTAVQPKSLSASPPSSPKPKLYV